MKEVSITASRYITELPSRVSSLTIITPSTYFPGENYVSTVVRYHVFQVHYIVVLSMYSDFSACSENCE